MKARAGLAGVALLAAIVMSGTPAPAAPIGVDLDGQQLSATLFFNGGSTNQFDPDNLHVPPGFGNSPAPGGSGEPSAVVSDTEIEFGYEGGAAAIQFSVDFTTFGQITVQGTPSAGTFTSTNVSVVGVPGGPFATPGLGFISSTPVSFGSCGFANQAFNCSFGVISEPFTIVGQLTPLAVPGPASLALLGFAFAGLAVRFRRSRSA